MSIFAPVSAQCDVKLSRVLGFEKAGIDNWISGVYAAQATALGHKQSAH